MASVLSQTFIEPRVVGLGDFTDIDVSLTGVMASGTVIRGLTDVICGLVMEEKVSAEDSCFFFINTPVTRTANLPCADLSVDYYQNLAVSDTLTTSYSLIGGTLPPGLTLSSTGVISGTPEPFRFTVQISDMSGATPSTKNFAVVFCCDETPGANTDSAIDVLYPTRFFRATNFTFVRGDSFRFQSTVYMNGEIVDLTGAGVRLTAKYDVSDEDSDAVFAKYSPFNGISITDAANGIITVTLDPSDTASLPRHTVNLVYDIQLYYPVLEVYTFQSGVLTVLPDISHSVN